MKIYKVIGVLHLDPGELNYPREPDVPASAFFECMDCYHAKMLKDKDVRVG